MWVSTYSILLIGAHTKLFGGRFDRNLALTTPLLPV